MMIILGYLIGSVIGGGLAVLFVLWLDGRLGKRSIFK